MVAPTPRGGRAGRERLGAQVVGACRGIFPTVEYAFTTVPTYPSGQIGFVMCSLDDSERALVRPTRAPPRYLQARLNYYNPDVHAAAFVLPEFASRALREAKRGGSASASTWPDGRPGTA